MIYYFLTSFFSGYRSEDEGLDAYDDAGIHLATHPSLLQLHAITFKKLSNIIELPLQNTCMELTAQINFFFFLFIIIVVIAHFLLGADSKT